MGRGRPKGAGRWSPFQDGQIWARMKLICETEGKNVSEAASRLANRGYFQIKSDDGKTAKYWASNRDRMPDDPVITEKIESGGLVPGDIREREPQETFRSRYYAAERRRKKEPHFKESTDAWLADFRRAQELRLSGMDPEEALWQAFFEKP